VADITANSPQSAAIEPPQWSPEGPDDAGRTNARNVMRLSCFKPMVFASVVAVVMPLLASLAFAAPAGEPSAVGLWEQVDENTGNV